MNLFVAVQPKNLNDLEPIVSATESLASKCIPFWEHRFEKRIWKSNRTMAISCSIHGKHTPIQDYAHSTDQTFCTFNGAPMLENVNEICWGEHIHNKLNEGSLSPEKLGGYYNLLYIEDNIITAWNAITRVEPIYWIDTPLAFAVGNRASLVYALANQSTNFQYDFDSYISMVTAGWFAHDRTPLKGVNLLAPGQIVKYFNNRFHVSPYKPYTYLEQDNKSDTQISSIYDEMTERMCHAYRYYCRFTDKLRINLSGGKDSRLMAAIAKHSGVPFLCQTAGDSLDREVVVAREVAKILDVEHLCSGARPGSSAEQPRVDIFAMLQGHCTQSDGMLNVFEPIYPIREIPDILLNGHGGECLRGGYDMVRDGFRPIVDNVGVATTFLSNLSLRHKALFLTEAGVEKQQGINQDILDRFSVSGFPMEYFYDFMYTEYREGRGISNARQAAAHGAFAFSPFLDDRLLQLGWKVSLGDRKSDLAYYNILRRVSPELANHRFSDSRWKFEQEGPLAGASRTEWEARSPLPPSPPSHGQHNWRVGYDGYLRPILKEFILDQKHSPLWNLINYNSVAKTMDVAGETPYAIQEGVFGIATALYFTGNFWVR